MKVMIERSTTLKPVYDTSFPRLDMACIPLNAFDEVTFDGHVAVVYAFRPPCVPVPTLKLGLQRIMAVYPEWAGRLEKNHTGETVILMNDQGVRFVEALVESRLDQTQIMLKPSPALQCLYPSLDGVDEILQVQVTNFGCGSMMIGFTTNHSVADGQATSNFLVEWGRACRGLDIGTTPLIRDRSSFFVPRDPPEINLDHHLGAEYTSRKIVREEIELFNNVQIDDIAVQKVHFPVDFLREIKAKAWASNSSQLQVDIAKTDRCSTTYSTFEYLVAHIWRAITKARSVSPNETTRLKISVNGRSRMSPRIPNAYFGNLVLWAFPSAKVKDLLQEPLSYATKLIHDAILKVNDSYFRSFIDFTETMAKHDHDITPTARVERRVLCPDVEVDSWLRLPFCDLDFGSGSPFKFMPMYYPSEGCLFILPSCAGDGSIDVFVPVFKDQLGSFMQYCHILD